MAGVLTPVAASAQPAAAGTRRSTPPTGFEKSGTPGEVVITGERLAGTAIRDMAPIAILDENAIRAMAASNLKALVERLKPLAASANGGDPIILLNGRRISGFGEIGNLPPEAIARTEILSEQEAVRFGYPPTVRVMNFITKKSFRGTTVQELGGTTTDGGGTTNYVEVNATRIDGPRRLSLSVSHLRLYPVLQSQRDIVPDAAARYAVGGNVTGVNGGSIDTALDALVGRQVTIAAVPSDPALRRRLGSYVATAGRPAITDVGAYRSLQERSDTLHIDGTLASPIGKTLDGSINLAVEAQRGRRLNGLASAMLTVPSANGAFPFADDVELYRYLPNAILRQRNSSMTVHAAGTLQGGFGQWAWNVTTSYDRVHSTARSKQGLDLDRLQASIDAEGDPMSSVDPGAGVAWLTERSNTVTGTLVTKAVVNGPLVRLPAGDAQLTLSADHARSTSSDRERWHDEAAQDLGRTLNGASVNVDLPITSSESRLFRRLGGLIVNGMIGVSEVSNYGRLINFSYGLNWRPAPMVQFSASVHDARTAPEIALLTSPVLAIPNMPFFDFTTGTSILVTTITGGNPGLAPERRRVTRLGAEVQPVAGKELRIGLDYLDTRLTDQSTTLGSATSAFQAAFPGRFMRDASGRLTSVDLRPINVAREHERKIRGTINFSTPIGPKPKQRPAADGIPVGGSQKKTSGNRPTINVSLTMNWRLEDRLNLRADLPSLDLLGGGTLTGTGGRPRWDMQGELSGTAGPVSFGLEARFQGPTRISSEIPASDLHFSGRIWLVPYASLDLQQIVKRPWAHSASVQLTIENLLNDRIDVRDRTGSTPDRFQPAYIDPLGRSVRLGLRKVF